MIEPMMSSFATFTVCLLAIGLAWYLERISAVVAVVLSYLSTLLTNYVAQGGRFKSNLSAGSLSGQVVIVTGSNVGIGYETARTLAGFGASVVMACRRPNEGERARQAILNENPSAHVIVMELDLFDLDSVRQFVREFRAHFHSLDILINNAGVMHPPFSVSKEGLEAEFAVNHVGHFLLTMSLVDLILAAPAGRVVNVASIAHWFTPPEGTSDAALAMYCSKDTYDFNRAYAISKIANIQFTYELQRRVFAGTRASAYSLHPGGVATDLMRSYRINSVPVVGVVSRWLLTRFFKTCLSGAQTSLFCALSPKATPGAYHADCEEKACSPLSYDDAQCKDLWARSEKWVGLSATSSKK